MKGEITTNIQMCYTSLRISGDETGCFWRALSDKRLGQMKQDCKDGKKSKHRVTIAFFVNGAGESESLSIVI